MLKFSIMYVLSKSEVNKMMNIKQSSQVENLSNSKSIICSKCNSTQIMSIKRGYSFSLMFKVLLSMIGVCVLVFLIFTVMYESRVFDSLDIMWLSFGVVGVIAVLLVLAVPTAMLCGFIGRNNIVNGCMNCGSKWMPIKK